MKNKKVLVVADIKGWAFDNIYQGLNKYSKNMYYDVFYMNQPNGEFKLNDYDVILYLCDSYPLPLINWVNNGLNKDKVVLAVRSNVTHPLYDSPALMQQVCGVLAVANEKLYNRFKDDHPKTVLAPGGIDTDFYSFKRRYLNYTPKTVNVGWSGSTAVFDSKFRGLDITQQACDELQLNFVPALKENRFRNKDEMKTYYHDEIDIYVEMSESAGRQNGLIEAGSCGVPIISYDCGVASNLINDYYNGRLLKSRNVELLKSALTSVIDNHDKFSVNIREEIQEQWSWHYHATVFEQIFNNM